MVLPLSELCIWVDPLDGTKEFTQGRYEFVSTLILASRVSGAQGLGLRVLFPVVIL